MIRRSLVVLALATALCGGVAGSPSPAIAGDNAAVAVNLRDGSSTFRLAFKITRVNRDVVDSANAAVAAASCTDCKTVAVALQAVLVFSDASVITPTNFAFAYNVDCERCYTLATAYQFVSTTGVVRFTAEGNRRIAWIRQELEALRHADLSIEEIQARVDVLAGQLLDVMRTEIVVPGASEAEATASDASVPVTDAMPAEATASSTETAPPPPTQAEPEPTPTAEPAEAPAEQTADTTTDTSGADAPADDSSASGVEVAQTSPETTSEPTTEPAAETSTP